jgi:Tfp pilus assembly protein PilO
MVLKTREKIFIGAAVLIGVVMGLDQFLTQPKKKEIKTLQNQVQEYNEKLASVTASLAGLNPIKKRVEEKRKEKETLAGRIPDDRQLGLLLDQIGKESQQKQMDLIQLNINDDLTAGPVGDKNTPKAGAFKKVILEVGLQAGYGTIGPYLEGAQDLPIFMEIEKVDIRRKEDSFPKLQVTVQQIIYISSLQKKESQSQENGRPIQSSH